MGSNPAGPTNITSFDGAPARSFDISPHRLDRRGGNVAGEAAGMRFKANVSPWWAGLVLGLGAAFVQGFYRVIPPEAYGVCFAGHSRDLLNWVANGWFGTNWFVEAPSLRFPVLTVAGVVAGSWLAARQHGELSPKAAPAPGFKSLIYGFITVNLALIVGACPTRSVLLAAYGDMYGIGLLMCIALGVVVGAHLMRSRARRAFAKRSPS